MSGTHPGVNLYTAEGDFLAKEVPSPPVLLEEDEMEVLAPDLPNILQNEMVARKLSQQDNTRGIGFGRSKRQTRHRKESFAAAHHQTELVNISNKEETLSHTHISHALNHLNRPTIPTRETHKMSQG